MQFRFRFFRSLYASFLVNLRYFWRLWGTVSGPTMQYWSSSAKIEKRYRLHPIGLVKQGLFYWLVAVKDETAHGSAPTVQTFKLNRINAIARRQQETVAAGLPTLAAALDGGGVQFFPGAMISLRARFAPGRSGTELCENYREAPLSKDQQIFVDDDGQLQLRATVRESHQLLWMLQGQANLMRILEPTTLKEKIDRYLSTAVAFQAA